MKKFIVAASLALVAVTASAAGNAWYVGADVAKSTFKADGESESKTGFGAFLGYELNQNFAIETGYRRLGSWDLGGASVKANALQLSALGVLPFNNGLSIYARLGVGRNTLEASSGSVTASVNSTAAVVGIGAGFEVSKNFRIRAEYTDLGNNKISGGGESAEVKINQISVGAIYSF